MVGYVHVESHPDFIRHRGEKPYEGLRRNICDNGAIRTDRNQRYIRFRIGVFCSPANLGGGGEGKEGVLGGAIDLVTTNPRRFRYA